MVRKYFNWNNQLSVKDDLSVKHAWGIRGIHEKICTNDCLLNFKWKFEFTTNYDFDEFIFPRIHETNYIVNYINRSNPDNDDGECVKPENKQIKTSYNLYEYAKRMSNLSSKKVAQMQFKHVVFMVNDHKKFLKDLFELKLDNKK